MSKRDEMQVQLHSMLRGGEESARAIRRLSELLVPAELDEVRAERQKANDAFAAYKSALQRISLYGDMQSQFLARRALGTLGLEEPAFVNRGSFEVHEPECQRMRDSQKSCNCQFDELHRYKAALLKVAEGHGDFISCQLPGLAREALRVR